MVAKCYLGELLYGEMLLSREDFLGRSIWDGYIRPFYIIQDIFI